MCSVEHGASTRAKLAQRMPEGDTIHRAAARLRQVLVGQRIEALSCDLAAAEDWQLAGRELGRVEARGKHLLIHCAPLEAPAPGRKPDPRRSEQLPVAIWTHMGMKGRWRVHPVQAVRPPRAAIVLCTRAHLVVCTQPKIFRLLGPRGLLRERSLAQLGPDLLDPAADLDQAVTRLRSLRDVALGDAIMDQRAVSGIGNVYKSELLFLEGLDPFQRVDALGPERLRALLERTRELMQRNLDEGGPRRTRFDPRAPRKLLWVYERSGRPCPRCQTIVKMRRQGRLARSTYYCPSCQPSTKPST